MLSRLKVAIQPATEAPRFRRLFDALERLFPVSFHPSNESNGNTASDAALLVGVDRATAVKVASRGLPCYAAMGPEHPADVSGSRTPDGPPTTVFFPGRLRVDPLLDGQTLVEFGNAGVGALAMGSGDIPVAECGERVFWARHGEGRKSVDLVAAGLPVLGSRDYLCHFFSGNSFCSLLPLLCFLRRLCAERLAWTRPPLGGCFIFDDPSLRHFRYGCLDFRQLARTAQEQGIHAVVATIPIDVGGAKGEVCRLFREKSGYISLTPHGNNHVRCELARGWDAGMQLKLMAQALRRMDCLATRHGLKISRVMEPPYGVVDHEFIKALALLDYEGVMITPSQFLRANRSHDWTPSFGMERAETFPSGLAIIPRIVMGRKALTEMVLAAFLGQPVVLAAHHHDVADGMDWIANYTARLRGAGPIQWSDLSALVQRSYETLSLGDILRVRPGARSIQVCLPESARAVVVERPWVAETPLQPLCVQTLSGEVITEITSGSVSAPIPVPGGTTLRIQSLRNGMDATAEVEDPGFAVWPKVRRTLMEARDRVYPWSLRYLKAARSGQ
ncbi:MAG: hypothetical protein HYR88_05295 [Verrucomicrobia bacterium]|nr:hypothetical protein [Verrucomicrobiota bacterium]MBI3870800.1 hypothetical protein [Verrucomicrobiota bacterium]